MRSHTLRVLFVGRSSDAFVRILSQLSPAIIPIRQEDWTRLVVLDPVPDLIALLPGADRFGAVWPCPTIGVTESDLEGDAARLETRLLECAVNPWTPRPEDKLLGNSVVMARLRGQLRSAAESDAPILFSGENGTGKDLAAMVAHEISHQRNGPFVPVNCGAIPPLLAESEFFGSVHGAFTGAENRPGYCQQAADGTLFLDEIGELPCDVQAKLLRVVENHEVRRVGGRSLEPANFRLVCATNRDLQEAVGRREFREDLYYRINVIDLRMPPLRERIPDLGLLAGHFLSQHCKAEPKRLTRGALRKLSLYGWPGNVRQLRNVIQRAVIFSQQPWLDEADFELRPTQ